MRIAGEQASGLVLGASRRRVRGFRLTPPAMLILAAVVIVAGAVALATVSIGASATHLKAVHGVERDAAPRLIDAQGLYVALADADAAASTAFLRAGLEPPTLRDRYLNDIQAATDRLTAIARRRGLAGESEQAIATISRGLPIYVDRIESARSNSRQGFPVGAEYLRQASTQMRNELLAAAKTVYERAARDLYSYYDRGTSTSAIRVVVIGAGLLLFILLGVQVIVAVASRRVFNLGLVMATLLVTALATLSAGALAVQERALRKSQSAGAEQLLTLSTARILALQSLADENLDLIARGSDDQYLNDLALVQREIGGRQTGLLLDARINAERTHTEQVVNDLTTQTNGYFAFHDKVHAIDRDDYFKAVKLAVGPEADAEALLDKGLEGEIRHDGERLSAHTKDARTALDRMAVIVAVLAVFAAVLAVFGLQRRIREYA
jgi:hypothetical protein